jgi:hypothetical protein
MNTSRLLGACLQAISRPPSLRVAIACKPAPSPDRP